MHSRLGAAILLALSWTNAAAAQITTGGEADLYRSDVAGARSEPAFAPRPLRIGGFKALAAITSQALADSNVLNSRADAGGDIALIAAPSIRLDSDWGVHALELGGGARLARFAELTRENSETFDWRASGRFDLDPAAWITGRFGFARQIEPRGDGGVNVEDQQPIELDVLQSALSARGAFGPLAVSAGATVSRRRYADIAKIADGSVDQSFRNERAVAVSSRLAFDVGPALALFVAGSAVSTRSERPRPDLRRDSTGYTLLAGLRSDAEGLVIGEVAIGYRRRDFALARFRDLRGPTYDATIDWYPTPLLSVRVQAGQDIVNSALPQVAGIRRRLTSARVYYDPLRDLRLQLALRLEQDRYREFALATRSWTVTARAEHPFTRSLSAAVQVRYRNKRSSDDALVAGFRGVQLGLSLTSYL